MKSDPSEYKEIVKKLLEKTRQGRVEWSTDLGPDSFTCTLGEPGQNAFRSRILPNESEFSFTVRASDMDGQPVLTMLDGSRNEIFRATSNDLPTSPDEEETSALLNDLYELARRKALKIEHKLDLASALLDRV
jgi:hypothetical protein